MIDMIHFSHKGELPSLHSQDCRAPEGRGTSRTGSDRVGPGQFGELSIVGPGRFPHDLQPVAGSGEHQSGTVRNSKTPTWAPSKATCDAYVKCMTP